MKICFMTSSLSRDAGGLYQSVRGLAKTCFSLNQEVSVLGVWDKNTAADIVSWQPVPAEAWPASGPKRFSYARILNKRLREMAPDILQLHGLWGYLSIVTARWSRRTCKPFIVHPHGMLDPWAIANSHWKKVLAGIFYEREMLVRASCIRALCQSEAVSIRKYGCRNPICIIPNGIGTTDQLTDGHVAWRAEEREIRAEGSVETKLKKIRDGGGKVLLYLGRIHPKKGLANLLRAWDQTRKVEALGAADWVLAIAGWDEGGHEAQLKALTSDLGLLSSVFFPSAPNSIGRKEACYRQCDAFVLPSFSEGLPMVILEAWAYGKPVLMTPECNIPDGVLRRRRNQDYNRT